MHHELRNGLEEVGGVVLFLLPAMGVVEVMDHFGGFIIVTDLIATATRNNHERILPIICTLTFFLSSVIDNLTATIVGLKILRHVVDDEDLRRLCGGLVVLASNAGGAWSPIGDVTTTMLWIRGKISVSATVLALFLPSFVSGIMPLICIYMQVRARESQQKPEATRRCNGSEEEASLKDESLDEEDAGNHKCSQLLALVLGISCILSVPLLKIVTGLPPYLGMLLALGVLWLLADALHLKEAAEARKEVLLGERVNTALHKIDLSGLLFFTGILLCVGALNSAGVLHRYAVQLVDAFGSNRVMLCSLLGLSSAVVDNVPLVEASLDMFSEVQEDDALWQLVALAAGTGGSILSMGSVAGVTLMSMEGVSFIWYCRNISLWALFGFAGGICTYQLQRLLFHP